MNVLHISADYEFPVLVVFQEGEPGEATAQLMGGTALDGYTLGICGTYNGQSAIGLCGHSLQVGSTISLLSDGSTIGTVAVQKYSNGGYGDYAIATITSGHTTSNKVGNHLNHKGFTAKVS